MSQTPNDLWHEFERLITHFYSRNSFEYGNPLSRLAHLRSLFERCVSPPYRGTVFTFRLEKEYWHMAKKTLSNWNLVNTRLTERELSAADKWMSDKDLDIEAAVHVIVERGYKISITWVDNSNAYVVSVTGRDDHKINPESTLTTWSDSLTDAFWLTVYKILIVFDDGKWTDRGDTSARG